MTTIYGKFPPDIYANASADDGKLSRAGRGATSGSDGQAVENWSEDNKYAYKNGDVIRYPDGFIYEKKDGQWVRTKYSDKEEPSPAPLTPEHAGVEEWDDKKKYSYTNGNRVRFTDGHIYRRVGGSWQKEPEAPLSSDVSSSSAAGNVQLGIAPPYSLQNQSAISLKHAHPAMYQGGRPVGQIRDGDVEQGTGFLVRHKNGRLYVFTNYHVIQPKEHASGKRSLLLGYETEPESSATTVRLGETVAADPVLDYALVEVLSEDAQKAAQFGFLEFGGSSGPGEAIYMPNHAGTYPKGISFLDDSGGTAMTAEHNSDLGSQAVGQSFYHTAFADPGSSGSPVISRRTNKVVGLNYGKIGQYANALDTNLLRSAIEKQIAESKDKNQASRLQIMLDILRNEQ